MFRNISFGAAAVLAVGALAIGCSEDGDTIAGGNPFLTDLFPGSQIFENNVGDDGKAFTNQGQNADNGNAEIFWNVSDGTAIALYQLTSTNGNVLFYASWFNGTSFSTPVQIFGADGGAFEDPQQAVQGFKAMWINTAGSTVPEAAARNGDAVILFTRRDLGPNPTNGSTSQEDANLRLWMTYFDRSAQALPAANGVVGGFTVAAITVDDDNIITSAGTDPDVDTFGFVSDSLRASHEFTNGTDQVDSGEPTSFASIVYRKDTSTGSFHTGSRYIARSIVGDAVDNTLSTLLDAEEILATGVGTFATGDSVGNVNTGSDLFTVHNDLMFWQANIAVVDSTTTTVDTRVTATRMDADGVVEQINLGPAPLANQESDFVFQPRAAHVYGGDHNLASTDVIFQASGFRTDAFPATGDTASDRDLYVSRMDNEDALAQEFVQIDNFADTIVSGGAVIQVSGRDITNVDTRINRTGQYITILFQQADTDNDTTSDGATGVFNNQQLYVTVVQTRRTNIDPVTGVTPARDLDASVFNNGSGAIFQPQRVPADTAGLSTTTGEPDVSDGRFQIELAGGQAHSQADGVSPLLGCVIQSDSNQMNFTYRQGVDVTTGADEQNLLVNGIQVALGATDADAPDFDLVDANQVVVTRRDFGYGKSLREFSMDAGDVTRDNLGVPSGDSGRPLVFFKVNQNNPADDSVTGAFTETRAFVWDDGQVELLSTDDAREFGQVTGSMWAVTVPKNSDITGSPHHAGSTIHVFMVEIVQNDDDVLRLMTRSYAKGSINDADTANDALENRFTPNLVGGTLGDDPVQIDQVTDGPLLSVTQLASSRDEIVVLTDGSTVGVYFDEDEHLYFTDTATDALGWDSLNGLPSPQLVDNDSTTGIRVSDWDIRARPTCDQLPKSIAIFLRDDASQGANFPFNNGQVIRAYVRIHN
jgi:hypothetical protein